MAHITAFYASVVVKYKSPSGYMVRATFGTLLGIGDLASDLYAIAALFSLGHYGSAYAMVAMVCANLLVQVGPAPALPVCCSPARVCLARHHRVVSVVSAGPRSHCHDKAPRSGGSGIRGRISAPLLEGRRRSRSACAWCKA